MSGTAARAFLLGLIACLIAGGPAPVQAYLKFGFQAGGRTVDVRWPE